MVTEDDSSCCATPSSRSLCYGYFQRIHGAPIALYFHLVPETTLNSNRFSSTFLANSLLTPHVPRPLDMHSSSNRYCSLGLAGLLSRCSHCCKVCRLESKSQIHLSKVKSQLALASTSALENTHLCRICKLFSNLKLCS